MYEVILSNGDRAEADSESAALLAANTLRREAVANGSSPRIARDTVVTFDGVYDGRVTTAARNGSDRCS
jgi:hypothetical protein